MHAEAYAWVRAHATSERVSVLDIGGRNVNGSVRDLFPNAEFYMAVDIAPGPGVDIVANAAHWAPDRAYDVVVCTEVFEHTPQWPKICATAFNALRPGGQFIVTTAAPGRPEHSAVDGGVLRPGEYYGNVDAAELASVLHEAGFTNIEVDRRENPNDVRAVAVKHGAGS